jgi:uncharacterized repeat protein (TIGR01451 family)
LKVKQLTGGQFLAEDEETDESGGWIGKFEEGDQFPAGNYQLTFGDYQKNDYKLVAFCVSPANDGTYHLKTQTDAATGKATIIVKPGQETKIVALYAPRTLPFITMSKYAIDARTLEDATGKTQRVMKVVYPGQQFLYRIKYKNASDTIAKNLLIQDVLPEQFDVPDEVLNDDEGKYDLSVSLDAQGRTLIKRLIPELKAGEEGSIYIPVTLRATAFDK